LYYWPYNTFHRNIKLYSADHDLRKHQPLRCNTLLHLSVEELVHYDTNQGVERHSLHFQ
jgi:hypothetical protein